MCQWRANVTVLQYDNAVFAQLSPQLWALPMKDLPEDWQDGDHQEHNSYVGETAGESTRLLELIPPSLTFGPQTHQQ